ncbi:MAG: HDOD domain-containing protein [Sulfuricurvum sp.]|nr:HDOD domain-containing protein [Sulfuricurvum sp.]
MIDDIKSLPPLPISVSKIQELCLMRDVNISELTKVIESDPMLSANILKSVNSPLYGMSKEVGSIRQAVMLFGVSMIRGFAAANAIKKALPLDLSPYHINIDKLAEISALQLALVREWYTLVNKEMLPLLLSASFLMELGKLIVARKVLASGEAEAFGAEVMQGKSIQEIEKCYLGMDSYEISAMMFKHWNFEASLVDAVGSIANTSPGDNTYAAVLNVISKAIDIRGSLTSESLAEALKAIDSYGLDRDAFEKAVEIVKSNTTK